MKKRVLFINPSKNDQLIIDRMHMGLTLLGEILVNSGHQVKVLDYTFLKGLKGKVSVPSISEIVNDFKPEVIGISVFTYLYDESVKMLEEISNLSSAPVVLGGPHISLFPEDFMKDNRVSYIVRGEAEKVILDLVDNTKKETTPVIINSPLPTAEEIPSMNLDIAIGSSYLKLYQIQLSRGCPFSCSFCNINLMSGRKVRARDLELCIVQIKEAKKKFPAIEIVAITDDCPNFNKIRFKEFLKKFKEMDTGCILTIDNVRADLIDEETVSLYKIAGGRNLCLGVESGNAEVFGLVNKGESLLKIVSTAELVHKYQLELGLCFVIGLPEDNLERCKDSIELAQRLKPNYIFWNMCIPWPGTEVYDWFKKNGTIEDVRNFSTLIGPRVNFGNPPAFTPSFNKEERIKAWLKANLETYNIPQISWSNLFYLPFGILRIFGLAIRYQILDSFFKFLKGFALYKISSTIVIILRRKFSRPDIASP